MELILSVRRECVMRYLTMLSIILVSVRCISLSTDGSRARRELCLNFSVGSPALLRGDTQPPDSCRAEQHSVNISAEGARIEVRGPTAELTAHETFTNTNKNGTQNISVPPIRSENSLKVAWKISEKNTNADKLETF